jgi:hypothetical protein
VYRKAADPGDVVIQKQHFAIADTRGRVTATPVSVLPNSDAVHEDKNEILGVGRHQGGRRLISPGLHRIESVSSRCRILRKGVERTYLGRLIPRQSIEMLDFLPSVTLPNGYLFGSMSRGEQALMEGEERMVGRLDGGHAFELDCLLC